MRTEKKNEALHYVENKKFNQAIVEYKIKEAEAKRLGIDPPRISDYIGGCIYKIATKLSMKPCFINYSFRDEMIEDGIENVFLYFHNYDPNFQGGKTVGPNPFAYFTQIIYFAFLRRIGEEERKRYMLYKNFLDVVGSNDLGVFVDGDNTPLVSRKMYDNINAFMERFESKEEEKKKRRKQVKQGLNKFYEDVNEQ